MNSLPVFRWKATFNEQVLPQHHTLRRVDIQDPNGGLPALRFPDKNSLVPTEMSFPALPSWIEQGIELAAEQTRKIGPLCPVAIGAGKTKSIGVIHATVLLGDDVFDMERPEISIVFV